MIVEGLLTIILSYLSELIFIFLQRFINTTKMFPNDQIVNADVAKNAAQRLFRRYKNVEGGKPSLGKNQVNRLMKATYQAINMPYDPDEEDVFSFINVFDSNNDGKIELKDLEEMAVKYLCGDESVTSGLLGGQIKAQVSTMKSSELSPMVEGFKKEQKSVKKIQRPFSEHTKPQGLNNKLMEIKISGEEISPNPLKKVYTPRNKIPFKDSFISSKTRIKTQTNEETDKPQLQALLKRGKIIFQRNRKSSNGITEQSAAKTMSQTFELFGKTNFKPNSEDIRVWFKLCDRNKDGVVEWQDYQHFLQRNYERNQSTVNL